MFGRTCHMEFLANMVTTGTQPPKALACHYRLDPKDYMTECGVISEVINGLPAIVEGGNDYCLEASGGSSGRGAEVTAAERKNPKYDQGFSLGAAFELTREPPKKSIVKSIGGIIKKIVGQSD